MFRKIIYIAVPLFGMFNDSDTTFQIALAAITVLVYQILLLVCSPYRFKEHQFLAVFCQCCLIGWHLGMQPALDFGTSKQAQDAWYPYIFVVSSAPLVLLLVRLYRKVRIME